MAQPGNSRSSDSGLTLAEVERVLGKGIASGDWRMFFCPLHGDGQKHGGRGGRSLGYSASGALKCFAGCASKDVAAYIRQQLPLGRQPEAGWQLVEQYEYRLSDGRLVGIKGRWHQPAPETPKGYNKKFAWRTPDGDWAGGLKSSGLTVADMPLYRTERIPGHQGRIWFVEGERCVHALEEHGEVAVCPAGSASQVSFGSALDVLEGREVYIWPDNDDPGRKLAETVTTLLRAKKCRVRRILAPVGVGGDAVDYFRDGGTLEALLDQVIQKPSVEVISPEHVIARVPTSAGVATFNCESVMKVRYALETELTVSIADSDELWQRINIMSNSARQQLVRDLRGVFGDIEPQWAQVVSTAFKLVRDTYYAANPVQLVYGQPDTPPAEHLVDGLAVVGGGTILFGPPGKGKSQTCLLLAISVDAGLSDVFPVRQATPTLYINLERSAESMAARLARCNSALGLPEGRPLRFLNARGKALPDIIQRVREAIREHGIGLVVMDSISRAGLGDLNDNRTANAIVDMLNSLGISWIGIAHTPRDDDKHVYGSVHQEAGADVMARIVSENISVNDIRATITITKANDFRASGEMNILLRFDHNGLREAKATSIISVGDAYAIVRQAVRAVARTPEDIRKMTGLSEEVVEATLRRPGFVRLDDGRYGLSLRETVSGAGS